jgi:protein gp37
MKCYNFEPHLHPERLADPYRRKKPAKIFAVDMGDLFGKWVPAEWIEQVIKVIRDNPRHTFQLLTKNPKGAMGWDFPDNVWLGTSIDTQSRVKAIEPLLETTTRVKFISFEPLLEPIDIRLNDIDWIIIGGQTRPAFHPPREWVDALMGQARSLGVPVFLKDNIGWAEEELVRELPDV